MISMYDIEKVYNPETVAEALALLEKNPQAIITAGGTDVMIRLKERKLKEATLISLLRIKSLKEITMWEDGTISIGAGCSFTQIVEHPLVIQYLAPLAQICNEIGSPQIRNIATIGGNICNGAVSADSVPTLLTLQAVLEIASGKESHQLPLDGFHTGPGNTVLDKHTQLVTAIHIPPTGYRGSYGVSLKFGQRNAMEIATLGCAVRVSLNDTKQAIGDIRLAFGVAAPTPVRCKQTEQTMVAMEINDQLFRHMRKSLLEELHPRDSWRASKAFRTHLIGELSTRALEEAIAQGRETP